MTDTFVFERIPAGAETTPPPDITCIGEIVLEASAYETNVINAGVSNGRIALVMGDADVYAEIPTYMACAGSIALVAGYCAIGEHIDPGTVDASIAIVGGFPDGSAAYESADICIGQIAIVGLAQEGGGVLPPPDVLSDAVFLSAGMALESPAITSLHTALLRAKLALSSATRTRFTGTRQLRDVLAFDDALHLVFHEIIDVSFALSADQTIAYTAVAQMVDALLLGGAVGSATEAYDLIADALTFGMLVDGVPLSTLVAGLSLSASVEHAYAGVARMLDALSLDAALDATATLSVVMADTLALGIGQTTALDATSVLRDRLDFVLQVTIDNEQYVAWSMNVESRAATKYTNYPFNSFMRVGGKYYGATDAGVYLLEGDDDAGADIAAKMRLGMSALGSRHLKRIPAMYLGYLSNGDLLLKVITDSPVDGAREAHVYRLYANSHTAMREGRVKIGRGLQSVYFDFQIENVDGAGFNFDLIEFLPLVLDRRIRGNAGGKP